MVLALRHLHMRSTYECVVIFIYLSIGLIDFQEQIEEEFPFFSALHHILASHINVTPIVITTALGPQGSKSVCYLPPDNNSNTDDNSNIDPQLLNEPVATVEPLTPQQERSFGDDAGTLVNVMKTRTSGSQCGLKPSSISHNAIENACKAVSKLPQKHSLADTLMEIQQYVIFHYDCCYHFLFVL